MIDLSRELLQCMAIAWTCFAAGIWILSCYRQVMDLQWLGKGLVLMCPAILSAFSSHSVRVCEQVILSKQNQSKAVNERIYLASVTRADLGDGYQFHSEYYTDGSVKTRGTVPIGEGRASRHFGGTEAWNEGDAGATGRPSPLHDWQGLDGHAAGQRL
jgi:hypothetical protein